jgi:tetratricopeptide (TPR) repeat protein
MAVLAGCAPFRTMLAEREGRAHLQQVRLFTRQGNFEGALRENRKVLDQSSKTPPADAALFSMGLICVDRANPGRDYKKALGFFTQLLHDFPSSPFAAEAALWAGILENELAGRAHLQRMQLLTRQGDFAGALRENRKILDQSPKAPLADAALLGMGLVYADYANPHRDYKKALDFFAQLVTEFPESPFAQDARLWDGILKNEILGHAHLQRVQVLVSQRDFEGALRENQKMLDSSPKNPPGDAALFSMGLIHALSANPKMDRRKAQGYFMQLVKDFPESPLAEGARIWNEVIENERTAQEGRAHLQRVQLFIRKEDFEGALRECQKILALAPKGLPGDEALFNMGLIHVHFANPKMDYKKALNCFQRLRKEFPGSQFAEEARIWINVLEAMEKASRVDMEIDEKQKLLRK